MTTTTSGTDTGSVVRTARSRRVPWLVIAAIVAVLAVIGAWFVLSGDGTPTLTFDGETAVYDGPTKFDAGEVTFEFDASEYEPGVAMIVGKLATDITLEEVQALTDEIPASSPPPPFVADFEIFYVVAPDADDRIIERTVELDADSRYLLTANTAPDDTDRAHPAVIIEVE